MEAIPPEKLTSSRESACLNVLVVVLDAVNGSERRMITPTLATVSLAFVVRA